MLTFGKGCKYQCLLLLLFKLRTVKMFSGEMLTKVAMKRAAFFSDPCAALLWESTDVYVIFCLKSCISSFFLGSQHPCVK